MALFNRAGREVSAKVVYYGPGLSGKTTNLEFIHERAPADRRGPLSSISTEGDRTLFFDRYERTGSFFHGSELSALGRPASEAEKALLRPFAGVVKLSHRQPEFTGVDPQKLHRGFDGNRIRGDTQQVAAKREQLVVPPPCFRKIPRV